MNLCFNKMGPAECLLQPHWLHLVIQQRQDRLAPSAASFIVSFQESLTAILATEQTKSVRAELLAESTAVSVRRVSNP